MDLRQTHPDEPWLWRADWAAGEIHSNPAPAAVATAVLALALNAMAWKAAALVPPAGNPDHVKLAVWTAVFQALAAGLALWAVMLLLRWRLYGESRLQMKLMPGRIGGTLEGTIHLAHPMPPMRPVHLKLVCIHRKRDSGSGGGTTDTAIWSDDAEAASDGLGAVPVAWYIPDDCQPTGDPRNADRIFWKLLASTGGGLGAWRAHFEVPVFRTANSAEQAADAAALVARRNERVADFRPPPTSRIRAGLSGDGATEVYFPPMRSPGLALGLLAFFGLWSGFLVLIFVERAPLIFKVGWSFFEAIFGMWVVALLFGSTTARIRGGELSVVWRLFGMVVGRTRASAADIAEVRSVAGTTAGDTVLRRIQVRRHDGRTFNFGDGIRDPIEADWIAARVAEALGLAIHREADACATAAANRPDTSASRRERP